MTRNKLLFILLRSKLENSKKKKENRAYKIRKGDIHIFGAILILSPNKIRYLGLEFISNNHGETNK